MPNRPSSPVLNAPPQHSITFESQRELALYLAAWIDTEGCIMVHRQAARKTRQDGQFVVQTAIANTDLNALQMLREHTGGTIRFNWKADTRPNKRQGYVLQFGATRCRIILPLVQPFLVIKQRQADLTLEALAILATHRAYASRNTPDTYARLFGIAAEMRALNRTGPRQTLALQMEDEQL